MTRLRYRIALIFHAGASVFTIGWLVLTARTIRPDAHGRLRPRRGSCRMA